MFLKGKIRKMKEKTHTHINELNFMIRDIQLHQKRNNTNKQTNKKANNDKKNDFRFFM